MPQTKPPQTPVTDPRHVPVTWASELISIVVEGDATILTFGETVTVDGPTPQRRVVARIAIATRLLPQLAGRLANLQKRAEVLKPAEGSA
ncbi:hypothetical protein [Phenylobacterium sp.]|jgi:hypothetical protein|uniref:hypothetical protein n=1 Tax=Phenylobacterium sp. TaxID=1871053 RepID=UPI002F936F4D